MNDSQDTALTTDIVAPTDPKFLRKYLIMCLLGLGFSLWSLYDGLVKYPSQLPRAQAWQQMTEEYPESKYKDRWEEISAENNWSPKSVPKDEQLKYVEQNILFQWYFLAAGLILLLIGMVLFVQNKNRWIESNEEGVRSSQGNEFQFSQVTRFDKAKWEKKGIAVVYHDSPNGPQKFVMDDLLYDRKNTDLIVCLLESKIDPKMIVNGKPEPQNAFKLADASQA